MSRDQRRHDRYPIRLPVLVGRGKENLNLETTDVSLSGLFICTEDPPPLRELLRLELTPPSGGPVLRLMGMAVHSLRRSPGDNRQAGVGVQLFGLDADSKERWAKLVGEAKALGGGGYPSNPSSAQKTASSPAAIPPVTPIPPSDTALQSKEKIGLAAKLPELTIKPRQVEELVKVYQRAQEKGTLHVGTPVKVALGTRVRLIFIHPGASQTFALTGDVIAQMAIPTFTGLKVKLADFDPQIQDAFRAFVTAAQPWTGRRTAAG